MATAAATMEFQAEAKELLGLMIHSLYSHKEIFLRELLSNASDALDKLRFAALTDGELLAGDQELRIELVPDAAARTLAVVDNGIGMTRDEVVANIGTIASSGTRRFLQEAKASGSKQSLPELIGQFGVGFYSAFMVAGEVVLETRKAGEEQGVRWRSKGDGTYTLEEVDGLPRGTRVTLHLRELDEEEAGAADYTAEWTLREVVRRYSDFIEYPIQMRVERKSKQGEGDQAQEVTREEVLTLNTRKPLWLRSRAEITPEEYAEFYKHHTRDFEPPLETIHFKAEGAHEYTALLFLPQQKPLGLFDPKEAKSHLSLYVKRVFITADCEELAPVWLRFVRGLVDSSDLPLNVSRETLQHARQLKAVNKRVVRKVLEAFATLLKDRREEFERFWAVFGPVIKEGLYYDDEHRDELAGLCLFRSTHGDGWTTLPEYVARMKEGQPGIFVLAGPELGAVKRSPHLEAFAAKGYEVLFLVDQVDEFAFQRLTEFQEHPVRSVAKGELELEDEASKHAREERQKEFGELLGAVAGKLSDQVEAVRFSNRLTDSAAVLVSGEHDLSPHVERLLRENGQTFGVGGPRKRVLELNPNHALVQRLDTLRGSDQARFGDYCELLLGQALLAEGSPVPDPARLAKLVTELMVR
jgi:molecular chaperone HtpG